MSEDFFYRVRVINMDQVLDDEIMNLTLTAISLDLMLHGKTLQDYSLPTPTPVLSGQGYILVDQERSKYDAVTQGQLRDQLAPKLNQEQKSIYDQILRTITVIQNFNQAVQSKQTGLDYQIKNCFFC